MQHRSSKPSRPFERMVGGVRFSCSTVEVARPGATSSDSVSHRRVSTGESPLRAAGPTVYEAVGRPSEPGLLLSEWDGTKQKTPRSSTTRSQRNQSAFVLWRRVKRCDVAARELADRHYSRQTPGAQDFMPPGRTFVMLTPDDRAVWGVVENQAPKWGGAAMALQHLPKRGFHALV